MLTLTNLSNADCDVENLLQNSSDTLAEVLCTHRLDGIEFMLCAPWDRTMFPAAYIKGVHLMFWPSWLDFWRGDRAALLEEFGSEENVCSYYGSLHVADWVEAWKENLRQAAECTPHYVVFHVAHNRTSEMYTRAFSASDEDVIRATIELVNEIAIEIPQGCRLLFENLWWPGLTFRQPHLAALLLEQVNYADTGFMLDTGHLMNTNLNLKSEAEGAAYVLKVYRELGEVGRRIYGVHLHQSLSGVYTREMMRRHQGTHRSLSWREGMDYVLHVDRHEPFRTEAARWILDTVQPDYLVHEFLQHSRVDLDQKLRMQRFALGDL
ncbi:TIM barrel protein [Selenomonas sp. oral taxon 138]|uniref:TIM barrel protein n=1 Tax=Selenomonas sp. oral taxon 138 TaxID=712532 RepID=UPI0002A42B56|nr:TIM barrel protein [Selenomonas sp. oral taxon 138]EKX99803.1 AP endonuclease, family 2 [Selenomonas sp. oral taxon 138 str. F0429]